MSEISLSRDPRTGRFRVRWNRNGQIADLVDLLQESHHLWSSVQYLQREGMQLREAVQHLQGLLAETQGMLAEWWRWGGVQYEIVNDLQVRLQSVSGMLDERNAQLEEVNRTNHGRLITEAKAAAKSAVNTHSWQRLAWKALTSSDHPPQSVIAAEILGVDIQTALSLPSHAIKRIISMDVKARARMHPAPLQATTLKKVGFWQRIGEEKARQVQSSVDTKFFAQLQKLKKRIFGGWKNTFGLPEAYWHMTKLCSAMKLKQEKLLRTFFGAFSEVCRLFRKKKQEKPLRTFFGAFSEVCRLFIDIKKKVASAVSIGKKKRRAYTNFEIIRYSFRMLRNFSRYQKRYFSNLEFKVMKTKQEKLLKAFFSAFAEICRYSMVVNRKVASAVSVRHNKIIKAFFGAFEMVCRYCIDIKRKLSTVVSARNNRIIRLLLDKLKKYNGNIRRRAFMMVDVRHQKIIKAFFGGFASVYWYSMDIKVKVGSAVSLRHYKIIKAFFGGFAAVNKHSKRISKLVSSRHHRIIGEFFDDLYALSEHTRETRYTWDTYLAENVVEIASEVMEERKMETEKKKESKAFKIMADVLLKNAIICTLSDDNEYILSLDTTLFSSEFQAGTLQYTNRQEVMAGLRDGTIKKWKNRAVSMLLRGVVGMMEGLQEKIKSVTEICDHFLIAETVEEDSPRNVMVEEACNSIKGAGYRIDDGKVVILLEKPFNETIEIATNGRMSIDSYAAFKNLPNSIESFIYFEVLEWLANHDEKLNEGHDKNVIDIQAKKAREYFDISEKEELLYKRKYVSSKPIIMGHFPCNTIAISRFAAKINIQFVQPQHYIVECTKNPTETIEYNDLDEVMRNLETLKERELVYILQLSFYSIRDILGCLKDNKDKRDKMHLQVVQSIREYKIDEKLLVNVAVKSEDLDVALYLQNKIFKSITNVALAHASDLWEYIESRTPLAQQTSEPPLPD